MVEQSRKSRFDHIVVRLKEEYVSFEVYKKYFELKGEPMPQWVKE